MYRNAKIYSDGSHYIAIPYEPNPFGRRRKKHIIQITDKTNDENSQENEKTADKQNAAAVNKEELFETLFKENSDKKQQERKENITEGLRPYFKNENDAAEYAKYNIERKERNAIVRKVRLWRKVHLQDFNYFCTFTYDDNLHDEGSFRKSLLNCLKHYASRKKWKYIGVWERSPEKQRLHFHGIFYIPDGTMPGELIEKRDYNLSSGQMQTTKQNTYFNKKYGRSDFEAISKFELDGAIRYIIKYMEKSGEKLVYSRGLPTYFQSDIMEDDVLCRTGVDDRKLILAEDFTCWNEGEYIGKVSREVIERLPKSN